MYNKLFTKILDSSIWLAPDPHRLVWITLIAAMDEDGNAMFASAGNLAARARVSREQAEDAIHAFENPDPDSGDPDNDGRRIERFPGGWHVLNAHKYREMVTKAIIREQTRIRTARYRSKADTVTHGDAKERGSDELVTPSVAVSTSKAKNISKASPSQGAGKPPPAAIDEGRFPDFWSAWPKSDRKQDRKKCLTKWRALNADAQVDRIIAHVSAMAATKKWRDGFDPLVLTYLNGERWQDPIPPDRAEPEAKTTYTRDKEAQAARWMGEFALGKKSDTTSMEANDAARLSLD